MRAPARLPDWLAAMLKPHEQITTGGQGLVSEVRQQLPPRLAANLRRLALVVLRPDCLRSARAWELVQHLEAHYGAKPVALRILVLPPYLVDALCRYRLSLWGDNVWLHHTLFAQGRSAAILLAGEPETAAHLCARLEAAKGPSLTIAPQRRSSIRSRFGRQSSIHAVLHCSPDPGALLYEGTQLFSWDVLRKALGAAGSGYRLRSDLLEILLSPECSASATVFQALIQIQTKIIASLLLKSTAPAQTRLLDTVLSDLKKTDEALRGRSYRSQLTIFRAGTLVRKPLLEQLRVRFERKLQSVIGRQPAASTGVTHQLEILEQATGPLRIAMACWFLSGLEPYRRDDGDFLFRTLAEHNVPLSEWERTLIQAALRCDVNSNARWEAAPLYPQVD